MCTVYLIQLAFSVVAFAIAYFLVTHLYDGEQKAYNLKRKHLVGAAIATLIPFFNVFASSAILMYFVCDTVFGDNDFRVKNKSLNNFLNKDI
jgi:hypothetical protein